MNDTLRDYQQEMKLRLFKEWELHRSVMVQMPTGTGKTHLLAAIVREFLCGSGSRVWIVAHRRELVDQIEETVSRHGMSKEDGRVRVMSIQWLSRNRKHMDEEPDLIVIDEAHHALAETYRILWENYPEARKYNPQIQISAESETKRSIFREKDKTKRSKKESAQHSKSRNKSFVMTSVSAL